MHLEHSTWHLYLIKCIFRHVIFLGQVRIIFTPEINNWNNCGTLWMVYERDFWKECRLSTLEIFWYIVDNIRNMLEFFVKISLVVYRRTFEGSQERIFQQMDYIKSSLLSKSHAFDSTSPTLSTAITLASEYSDFLLFGKRFWCLSLNRIFDF